MSIEAPSVVEPASSAPRVLPLTYPGTRPATSVLQLMAHEWRIVAQPGRRLGQSRVIQPTSESIDEPALNEVLSDLNSPPMDRRVPVLAIGSNASGAQMRHKAQDEGFPLVVPMVRAQVTGLQVTYSSFVSSLGYVPATLAWDPAAVADSYVQFLDWRQLESMDRTEVGYHRVFLDPAENPVRIESGEILGGAYAYVSRGGFLAPGGEPLPLGEQVKALDVVRLASPELTELIPEDPEQTVALARADSAWRDRVNQLLAASAVIGGLRQLEDRPDHRPLGAAAYGSLLPAWPMQEQEQDHASNSFVVTGTPNETQRKGQSVVRLPEPLFDSLDRPRHALVRPAHAVDHPHMGRLAVVAGVQCIDSGEDQPAGTGQVDESLRIALGLEVGERAVVETVDVPRSRWPDLIFGAPNYVALRVHLADVATTEREVCLVSPLTLAMLGVSPGDHISLEGLPRDGGRAVSEVTLKAYELPAEIAAERKEMSQGSWGFRFPSSRRALGVHPDVPDIFIDAAIRHRLGLGPQQLAVVRARPLRRNQALKELQELLLVIAIALVGLIGVFGGSVKTAVLVGFIGLASALVITARLRGRLSHRLDQHDGGSLAPAKSPETGADSSRDMAE